MDLSSETNRNVCHDLPDLEPRSDVKGSPIIYFGGDYSANLICPRR